MASALGPDFPLAGENMCQSFAKDNCIITGYIFDNNIIKNVRVEDGDAIILDVNYIDWDDSSANDTVCLASLQIGPYTLDVWQAHFQDAFTILSPDTGSGKCTFKGTITAVGTP